MNPIFVTLYDLDNNPLDLQVQHIVAVEQISDEVFEIETITESVYEVRGTLLIIRRAIEEAMRT